MRSNNLTLRGYFVLISVLSGACIASLVDSNTFAQTKDNELKAAYIAKFTEFVHWPVRIAEGGIGVFTICVYGSHPIQSLLVELPRLMSVGEQSIEVNRINHPERAGACEILFVPVAENNYLPKIRQYTYKKPVLVINEVPDVHAQGQLTSLYKEGDRLHIQIHLQEVHAAEFNISSQLLKLANVVE